MLSALVTGWAVSGVGRPTQAHPVRGRDLRMSGGCRGSLVEMRWRLAVFAVGLTVLPTACGTSSKGATATSTTSSTSTAPSISMPTTTSLVQRITEDSPTGSLVWQTGDPIPGTNDAAYQGYYCCNPPFPDGYNRSGSAGCSGTAQQGLAPPASYYASALGGYFLNGQRC